MLGKFEQEFNLYTNDARQMMVTFRVTAMINPVPEFIKRIENAEIDHGNQLGNWVVWPTASPAVTVELGERLNLMVRLRPLIAGSEKLELQPMASDAVKGLFASEPKGNGYWLKVEIQPADKPGQIRVPLVIKPSANHEEILINLSVNVIAENVVATPKRIEIDEVGLTKLAGTLRRVGRVGVRKIVGNFQIKSVSTTLTFLRAEVQTVIEGSGYLVTVTLDESRLPQTGNHQGVLRIATDDRRTPMIEIPINFTTVKD